MDVRPGSKVYGAKKSIVYEVGEPLGNGAFGWVFAITNKTGKKYALKTIPTASLSEDALKALINEGALATKVEHENVLRVLFFHDGNLYPGLPPYMIMESAEQGTLENVLNERKSKREQFNQEEIKDFFTQLASGMKAVNEVLVHRDIKPDNILISKGKLKIADFGLSKLTGAATRNSTFKGTNHPRYCAPEAWRNEKNLPSMDMYSMGIVFYEIATLTHPYQVNDRGDFFENWKNAHLSQPVKDPRALNPALDLSLAQMILKMVAKRPEERYRNWEEVISRIRVGGPDQVPAIDTTRLVEHLLLKRKEQEQARLEKEQKENETREYASRVAGAFTQVKDAAASVVNSVNHYTDLLKLELHDRDPMSFSILCPGGTVNVAVQPEKSGKKLDSVHPETTTR